MKVIKFGGTSVKGAERIQDVIKIVKADKNVRAVICSAFGGITDKLIYTGTIAAQGNENYAENFQEIEKIHVEATRQLIDVKKQSPVLAQLKNMLNELEDVLQGVFLLKELSKRTLDYISAFGERLSCFIIAEAFKDQHIETNYLDSRLVVVTDSNFGDAKVDFEASNLKIRDYFSKNPNLQIVTGFIASDSQGITTTLGRGGSDYSASIFAAALDADDLEIWTDVDGVMTADPRKVSKAFTIDRMTYEEAMEMSHFGAKVIYSPTMVPVLKKNIPIWIKNTFNPSFRGTLISSQSSDSGKDIKGISSISNIALLRIQGGGMVGLVGFSGRLFTALAQARINVILITQASSEHTICIAVKPEDGETARQIIEREFSREIHEGQLDKIVVEYNLAIVAIVGENMRKSSGVAGKMFAALGKNGINIHAIAQGSSELNISVVIRKDDEEKALRAIHQGFFLSNIKTIHLFVVGTGLIGSTLLKQIEAQREYLLKTYNLEFKIVAVADVFKCAFDTEGIELTNWQEKLQNSEMPMSIDNFVNQMCQLNLLNSVFVDNTASKDVAAMYQKILSSSISIVTPNKIASSSDYKHYTNLKNTAKNRNVFFLYETNVGAALPVISTLKDLTNSGDKIVKIEAILSGTLSYIFNNFDGSMPFSQVVKKAKELGYTEPDPRLDLNGSDVARKILILSRESGVEMEFDEVKINGFVPESCMKAPSVDEFFVELEKYDHHFAQLHADAKAEGKVLRFIAQLEKQKASLSLQAVDQNHAFYNLSGSDNIIAFTTMRYIDRPLVVKGSGAGAEVTAAGVFADIIRIGNYL